MIGESGQQSRVSRVHLLLAHPVMHVREGDKAEVAGGQHDRLGVARGPVLLTPLLARPAQRGTDGGAGLGPAVGALGLARHGQPAAGPDQVAEGEPVAGAEGLAGALAVVGEDDDAVRARGVFGDVLDQGERAVQALKDLRGVAARRPGVVGDLVVGDEVGVDGRTPGEHVAHDGGDHDIAFHDGREGADERVQAPAAHPGTVLAYPGAGRLADLAADLGEERHGGADGVGGVGEVGEVAGPGAGLTAAAAGGDGQDEGLFLRAAREEVASARAVDGEQSAVSRLCHGPVLEFDGAGRAVADHHLAAVLLVPAEGGDVVVAAVQDAELAGTGLAGPVGAPGGEPVGGAYPTAGVVAVAQPSGDRRHESVADRGQQDVVAHSVELEEDRAGGGRTHGAASAAAVGETVQAAPVGVVVAHREGTAGGGGDRGHHGGHHDRGLRGGVAALGGVQAQGEQQQCPVEEEDEEPEHQGRYEQEQPYEQRPHDGRQHTEGTGAERRRDRDPGRAVTGRGLEPEVRQDARQHQHRQGRDDPYRDAPPDLTGHPPPTPCTHAPYTSRPGPSSVRALGPACHTGG